MVVVLLGAGACSQRKSFEYVYEAVHDVGGVGDATGEMRDGDGEGRTDLLVDLPSELVFDVPTDISPDITPDELPLDIPLDITAEVEVCTPECDGLECGSDGCGGECGECGEFGACKTDGTCLCEFEKCGIECCSEGMLCFDDECCLPECNGMLCGDDGCGGECGECDDGKLCTDDTCTDVGQCQFVANEIDCDDGNPCTGADKCSGGICTGTILPPEELAQLDCICEADEDCAVAENGDLCDGTLVCDIAAEDEEGICVVDETTVLACTDLLACTMDSCDPESGCVYSPDNAYCDDDNICTDDACSLAAGCEHEDNSDPCADGSLCTVDDLCADGACEPGEVLDCEDGLECTIDSCDPGQGCLHMESNELCDDANPCTDDLCSIDAGECLHMNNDLGCDDGDLCTVEDVCAGGICSGTPKVCDDSLWCSGEEQCDPLSGDCVTQNVPVVDDGVSCTVDECDEENQLVLNIPDHEPCDDQNECTTTWCDSVAGCQTEALPDDAPCQGGAGWYCSGGECVCTTDCKSRQCGNDGCGGSCGDCGEDKDCDDTYGVCISDKWVIVPGGDFFMGSDETDPCSDATETPRHPVTLTHALLVSDHEVTQGEWKSAMPQGTGNPSFHGPDGFMSGACVQSGCPVEMVSWVEAVNFCNTLSTNEGLPTCYAVAGCTNEESIGESCAGAAVSCEGTYDCSAVQFKGLECAGYRLPTEAEWEYLARGGVEAPLPVPLPGGGALEADECGPDCVEKNELTAYASYCGFSGIFTTATGQKSANGFGLYDMAGNVREWTFDYMDPDYYASSPAVDPVSSKSPPGLRVIRGGDYSSSQYFLRPAVRSGADYRVKSKTTGMRVVRTLPEPLTVP